MKNYFFLNLILLSTTVLAFSPSVHRHLQSSSLSQFDTTRSDYSSKNSVIRSLSHNDDNNNIDHDIHNNIINDKECQQNHVNHLSTRSSFLQTAKLFTATTTSFLLFPLLPNPSNALVKGNTPPPPKKKKSSDDANTNNNNNNERKCSNVEECQEMAERKLDLERKEEELALLEKNENPIQTTAAGTRYRDITIVANGDTNNDATTTAKLGDVVNIRYKVLKLGKRSYDGLSGEGTVIFSRGYGLEDDETGVGTTSFSFTLGSPTIIKALNDALPGMKVGTIRRISIVPQSGWEKPDKNCDGGPGGSGSGGELKTDYVVVPTATMVATEICMDKDKLPFPNTYAQQRRMAQRFDQSLIMEVDLVSVGSS